jgi:hypothetical protein
MNIDDTPIATLADWWGRTDDDDDDAPWEPPGMYRPKVGDRVRIRLSAECPEADQSRPVMYGHEAWTDGAVGIVRRRDQTWPNDDHPYLVQLPHEDRGGRYIPLTGYYAAVELVPLDDAATADDGGE